MCNSNDMFLDISKFSKKTVIAGFILAGVGWLLAAVLEDRQLGSTLFFIGFFIAATGIVVAQLFMRVPKSQRRAGLGLKIGAIGFGICCLSGLLVLAGYQSVIANYIFVVGGFTAGAGILVMFLNSR